MEKNFLNKNSALLCLCLTACSLSAPLNGLSPSLSLVAKELKFSARQRDMYLGSYISLFTMTGQLIGSCFSGIFNDYLARKLVLEICLLTGSVGMILFGTNNFFPLLLFCRSVSGFSQGAIVPIVFSLIGDLYGKDDRASKSAIVSSFLGGGMMLGQLFTGFFLEDLGWRMPFVIMGIFAFSTFLLVHYTFIEPQRGACEEGLAEMLSNGGKLPPMSSITCFKSVLVPTVMLMIVQTVPNTIPWGILCAHLHDLLATDSNISMTQATSLIGIFGMGGAVGGMFGGYLGARLYSNQRYYLPLFMGLSMGLSAVLMKHLLLMDLSDPSSLQFAYPLLVISGVFASITGANIRIIILNITSPEARGALIAVLSFINCLGKGLGPSLFDMYMIQQNTSRREAIRVFLNFWFASCVVVLAACTTIARDEDRLKEAFKKLACKFTSV